MQIQKIQLFSDLSATVEKAKRRKITPERKGILKYLIEYIQEKVEQEEEVHLNFICTHNSRRSQFSQIWAQTAADYYGIPAQCYSGGVEVTAFNERAVASIKRSGFSVSYQGESNPLYYISYSDDIVQPISTFSKLFDDPINKAGPFAAVMTCAHADKNCPFIPGTEKRIAVRYNDPKEFDDTPLEVEKYDERSLEIASEMFYVFGSIKKLYK